MTAREHAIKVSLSAAELALLDERRGAVPREVYLRRLLQGPEPQRDIATRSEALGLLTQLARDGRTAAVIALAAELRLLGGERVFDPLNLKAVERAWKAALGRARIEDPQLVVHDLRHTHVSGLIADGWDIVEIAARVGDRIETVLGTYSHEFDAKRRSALRRASLEERYGAGMATHTPS